MSADYGGHDGTLGSRQPGPADIDSTHNGIGCSLSWNLPCHLQLFRMTIQQAYWQPGKPSFSPVFVNFVLIILAILVVIFSIWGYPSNNDF